MRFQHSDLIWRDYPELVPCALAAGGISPDASVEAEVEKYYAVARSRLDGRAESEFDEIGAWRRTFSRMGLKPTQYRCAAESLLRRFRKEGSLPSLHPLIDVCNAISLAFAIPVAVIDVAAITGGIEVRYAAGDEDYVTFSGDREHPAPGEVIFADAARRAHARRWTNRQSGLSAVREQTTTALIVAEALHPAAAADIGELTTAIAGELTATWAAGPAAGTLTRAAPRFTFSSLQPRGRCAGGRRP